jgi:membrane protease YdiL (CAAX protease family)
MKFISEPEQSFQVEQDKRKSRQVLFETVLLLALVFAAQFLWLLWPVIRTIFLLVPLVYFFVERRLRRRTAAEACLNFRAIPRDVVANWFLILLVSIVIPSLEALAVRAWMPEFLSHVKARFPFTGWQPVVYLPLLMVGTLVEEINYRALFQERLSWFIRTPVAIGIVSVVFGIAHWTKGDPVIVMTDVLLVIVDSVFFGIIFARSKNVYVAWIAHFLGDLFSLVFFIML